jgi:hypothetical protein
MFLEVYHLLKRSICKYRHGHSSDAIAVSHMLPLLLAWQVEKIFGPGNQYVTAAKMILQVYSALSI